MQCCNISFLWSRWPKHMLLMVEICLCATLQKLSGSRNILRRRDKKRSRPLQWKFTKKFKNHNRKKKFSRTTQHILSLDTHDQQISCARCMVRITEIVVVKTTGRKVLRCDQTMYVRRTDTKANSEDFRRISYNKINLNPTPILMSMFIRMPIGMIHPVFQFL